ncbi:hypothetical protein L7F22_041248 [Adiantum nelumboides]|nr:hypothetical protein [Adiantum nelumboides]
MKTRQHKNIPSGNKESEEELVLTVIALRDQSMQLLQKVFPATKKINEESPQSRGAGVTDTIITALVPRLSNALSENPIQADQCNLEYTSLRESDTEPSPVLKNSIATTQEDKDQVKVHGFVADASKGSLQIFPSRKKKDKKGGLSMFLSGALDGVTEVPVPVQASPVPKSEGPAWGGAKWSSGLSSLRDIQSQQTAEGSIVSVDDSLGMHFDSKSVRTKQTARDSSKVLGELGELSSTSLDPGASRYSLNQFIRTSAPIAVTPVQSATVCVSVNPDSSPTPWAGTSPLTATSSFKEIQMEQVKGKKQRKHCGSHGSSNIGSLTPAIASSVEKVADEIVPSRWFKPDTHSPSIKCIQIEEQAIKEIRRMYKNVKVVRSGEL